jgi:hydrogenase-4 component F
LAIAAVFILGQRDYKRMLAYSSIEHMGILALGVGLGGGAVFGALLHAVNHSLAKTALFFTAGNILGQYHTKKVGEVQGILRVLPISGVLWIAGFFAITGTPPGGIFLSKFLILQAAFAQGQSLAAVAFLVLLAVVFIGMIIIFLPMAQGVPSPEIDRLKTREAVLHVLPAVILLSLVLVLGLYLPPFLFEALSQAASMIGAK